MEEVEVEKKMYFFARTSLRETNFTSSVGVVENFGQRRRKRGEREAGSEGARRGTRGRGVTGLKDEGRVSWGVGVSEQGKWEERRREVEKEGCKYMGIRGLG